MCRGRESGPTGERIFRNTLGYDEKAKAYIEFGISSLGESEYSTGGSINGNKLTFVKELENDTKKKSIKLRIRKRRSRRSITLIGPRLRTTEDRGS